MNDKTHAITIQDRLVGDEHPCFVIAEAGVNHNGDPGLAYRLIDAACVAGADAIKFQTFKAENLVTPYAEKAEYQKKNDSSTGTQYQMLKNLELTEDDFKKLSGYARTKGLIFLSTAFDEESVDVLIRLGVPAFKIPSGEITNFPYIKKIAREKKPVILSTGMSTLDEVLEAVRCLQQNGCREIVLLHCTTSYPAPLDSVNLRAMDTLREALHLPAGYSDHTEGILVPVAAVARGACVIEKHITLDRTLPGPDHAASLEPGELREMVSALRQVELALGSPEKRPDSCEIPNLKVARKSIVAGADIPEGTCISTSMLVLKRPGSGIEPGRLSDLVGRRTTRAIKKDALISWDMVE